MRMARNFILIVLILLCSAFFTINSQNIDIRILPDQFNVANDVLTAPAYVVMLLFSAIGLLMGTLFEYLRTWRDRRSYRKSLREVEKLNSKIKHLSDQKISETDEILDLLK